MAFKAKMSKRFARKAAPVRSKDVCIIDTASVAGTKRIEGFEGVASKLDIADKLFFKRDRKNKFDEWSVNVYTKTGKRIGLLPFGENEIVARLLDSNRTVYGRVKRLEKRSSWVNLEMRIFLAA